jgi:nucleoside-diphosphate-sugar epimerase
VEGVGGLAADQARSLDSRWRGRRVLVTGGTGFLGRHVAALGSRLGAETHSLSTGIPAHGSGVHHAVDLEDPEGLEALVDDVRPEAILHLAARGVVAGADSPARLLAVNAGGLANLLEAVLARDARPRVVVAGTGYEYAPQDRPLRETDPLGPFTPYGVSKAAAALVAGHYAATLPVMLLRLFNLYGEGEPSPRLAPSIIAAARKGEPVELTRGQQVRDMTYVGDAAEAFWRALSVPFDPPGLRVLNVGTGRAVTVNEFVALLAGHLTRRGLEPVLLPGARPYRPSEPMTYLPDTERLRATLGWSPPTSLEQGLTWMLQAALG